MEVPKKSYFLSILLQEIDADKESTLRILIQIIQDKSRLIFKLIDDNLKLEKENEILQERLEKYKNLE